MDLFRPAIQTGLTQKVNTIVKDPQNYQNQNHPRNVARSRSRPSNVIPGLSVPPLLPHRRRKSMMDFKEADDDDHKDNENTDLLKDVDFVFNFVHDRIHESFYKQMNDDQRIHLHHRIGILLKQQKPDQLSHQKQNLFEVAQHLNIESSLITSLKDLVELIEVNFMASKEAFNSSAFTQSELFSKFSIKAVFIIQEKIDPSINFPKTFNVIDDS